MRTPCFALLTTLFRLDVEGFLRDIISEDICTKATAFVFLLGFSIFEEFSLSFRFFLVFPSESLESSSFINGEFRHRIKCFVAMRCCYVVFLFFFVFFFVCFFVFLFLYFFMANRFVAGRSRVRVSRRMSPSRVGMVLFGSRRVDS